jgi:hypothetical protein
MALEAIKPKLSNGMSRSSALNQVGDDFAGNRAKLEPVTGARRANPHGWKFGLACGAGGKPSEEGRFNTSAPWNQSPRSTK